MLVNDWLCVLCGGSGDLMFFEDVGLLCLDCVDFGYLVFLLFGDVVFICWVKWVSWFLVVVVWWSWVCK